MSMSLPDIRIPYTIPLVLAAHGTRCLELHAHKVYPGQAEPGVRIGSMRRIKGLELKACCATIKTMSVATITPHRHL
jgi:hypothetical protein